MIQDGILKAAFYLPDHLRLDGDKPAYEVFLDKENRQFLTYDHLEKKWRDAKLDRLEWPGRMLTTPHAGLAKRTRIWCRTYFSGERGGALGILDFQRNVRDEQLDRHHKRITDPWDQDLAQVPELPKDWSALGRQGGRAGKFYILPLQARRRKNRLLHLLREGGAHFRAPLPQQRGTLYPLPASCGVQGIGTRRLFPNR